MVEKLICLCCGCIFESSDTMIDSFGIYADDDLIGCPMCGSDSFADYYDEGEM